MFPQAARESLTHAINVELSEVNAQYRASFGDAPAPPGVRSEYRDTAAPLLKPRR
jgi:hypothetical protein